MPIAQCMTATVPKMSEQMVPAANRWADLPEVVDRLTAARSAVDELLWRRDVRAAAAEVTAESRARGARESAAMDGADIAAPEPSPMGRVLTSAQAVTGEVPFVVETWPRAPLQVLARLHAVAAHGHLPQDSLGRPRLSHESVDDPLHLGPAPDAQTAARRLTLLADLVAGSTQVPALVVAGIAHAEIVGARPFAWGCGLIGRAVVRVVMAARGVDPSLFSVPEAGMMHLGRPAYVRALRAYEDGDVGTYLLWFADAIRWGALDVLQSTD